MVVIVDLSSLRPALRRQGRSAFLLPVCADFKILAKQNRRFLHPSYGISQNEKPSRTITPNQVPLSFTRPVYLTFSPTFYTYAIF
jgi:hypothetical protein